MAMLAATHRLAREPNAAHPLSRLQRCSRLQELQQIHAHMLKTNLIFDTIAVSRLLAVSCSTNLGNLTYARSIFDRISGPNTYMWNVMIRGYADGIQPEEALALYHQMIYDSVPHNVYTFPFLLKACSSLHALEETRQVHAQVVKMGFGSETHTVNSILHAYFTSGGMESALLLFDRSVHRDIVACNTVITGLMKCGEIERACALFGAMPVKNEISWTSMISGYVQAGRHIEALDLLREMQIVGIKPDKVALSTALSACAHLGALDHGRWIHACVKKMKIEIDSIMSCALIDMYAKCGSMEEALEAFNKTEKKGVHVWTALVSGFAINGKGRDALQCFSQMQKEAIKPNLITFTGVLTACSHAGLVDEGKLLFQSIENVYGLKPTVEHYGCMVHLLGRAGLLKEATDLIERMPPQANAVIYGALLNACRIHGNLALGKQIGKILIELEPNHGGRYIHLASIYAAACEWEIAAAARKQMKDRGASKLAGCSTITLHGVVHAFFAGDRSHPRMEEVNHKWIKIAEQLRQEGYRPATRGLSVDLDEDQKETAISQHSEKLAIAFGLITTKPGTTVRIFKNLRVCEDCHTVTKIVSKIYDRVIIMRDRTRFHHFSDGKCSCCDYW